MDTAIANGDFQKAASGLPVSLTGLAEQLQRAYIRLGCQRGSFPYSPTLGSNLSALTDQTRTLEAVLPMIEAAMEGSGLTVIATALTQEGIAVTVRTPFGSGTVAISKGGI